MNLPKEELTRCEILYIFKYEINIEATFTPQRDDSLEFTNRFSVRSCGIQLEECGLWTADLGIN